MKVRASRRTRDGLTVKKPSPSFLNPVKWKMKQRGYSHCWKMAWDLIFWVLCFFINLTLVASSFYQLLSLSDLEADHLNPFEASTRINSVVLPEFLLQGFLCAFFLLTWHWFMFLFTVPLTVYHLMLYLNRKHLLDVTEIFRDLNTEKKHRFVKLGFYLLLFTLVLFRLPAGAYFFFPSKFVKLDI
ncbi:hypothetical protein REPUB_Repub06bG0126700 [Reevesia pubescens]